MRRQTRDTWSLTADVQSAEKPSHPHGLNSNASLVLRGEPSRGHSGEKGSPRFRLPGLVVFLALQILAGIAERQTNALSRRCRRRQRGEVEDECVSVLARANPRWWPASAVSRHHFSKRGRRGGVSPTMRCATVKWAEGHDHGLGPPRRDHLGKRVG
jgi:hypothetical protein